MRVQDVDAQGAVDLSRGVCDQPFQHCEPAGSGPHDAHPQG